MTLRQAWERLKAAGRALRTPQPITQSVCAVKECPHFGKKHPTRFDWGRAGDGAVQLRLQDAAAIEEEAPVGSTSEPRFRVLRVHDGVVRAAKLKDPNDGTAARKAFEAYRASDLPGQFAFFDGLEVRGEFRR